MLNKKNIIVLLFQIIFSYSIFDHTQDFRIPSSTYIASINSENFYNFYNPACNGLNQNKYLYSSFGNYFDGILKNQNIYFSINSKLFKALNFSLVKSSIDNIYNTTDAWNDDGNGLVDINEIDYENITTFDHNNLGLIISKSFILKETYGILPISLTSKIKYGINSKFSFSSLASEKSFSHSFDLGFIYLPPNFSSSPFSPNIGLLIKDILPYSYWSTGQIEKKKTLIILGSSFGLIKDEKSNQNTFYVNSDFNLSNIEDSLIGFEYQFKNNNNLISIQINASNIQNSLGFIIRLNNKFDIAYSFMIPNNNELPTSQKIMLGINRDILNNYIK